MSATAYPAATANSSVRRRALTVAAAVVACAVIWVIGALAGVDWTVTPPGRPTVEVGIARVIPFALGAALAGWAALAILERVIGPRATIVWTVLAVAVALVSLVPLSGAEATVGAKLALGAMHLVVAAILVPLLPNRR